MNILSAAETREVDRLTTERAGIPSLTLMENAGRSVAEFIGSRFPSFARRKILVLCGKGNNGGDGFVVARSLLHLGAKPLVYLFAPPAEVKGEARENLDRWKQASGSLVEITGFAALRSKLDFSGPALIVDALLGTGVRGSVEGVLLDAIKTINARPADVPVVSIDIPSGLNADSGEVCGAAVRADFTITFSAPKRGFFRGAASQYQGELLVREIGSPPSLIEEFGRGDLRWSEAREFARFAIPRKPQGHKGDYGHALLVAGSVGKSGAAVLASWAALRAGAGLVTVGVAEPALPLVAAPTPEVMTAPLAASLGGTISDRCLEGNAFAALLAGKDALGIGPGLTTHPETQSFVRRVVAGQRQVPIVLDADGLNAFAGRASQLKKPEGALAMTPHPGEMARLLGCSIAEVQKNRVELARQAAADWNAHVVLKGHHTVVASPTGHIFVNSTGNPSMASGGTGDVLTGMLAAMTAQFGIDDWHRVLAYGVYLHGLAGDVARDQACGAPLMASDLIRSIPGAYQKFVSACDRA